MSGGRVMARGGAKKDGLSKFQRNGTSTSIFSRTWWRDQRIAGVKLEFSGQSETWWAADKKSAIYVIPYGHCNSCIKDKHRENAIRRPSNSHATQNLSLAGERRQIPQDFLENVARSTTLSGGDTPCGFENVSQSKLIVITVWTVDTVNHVVAFVSKLEGKARLLSLQRHLDLLWRQMGVNLMDVRKDLQVAQYAQIPRSDASALQVCGPGTSWVLPRFIALKSSEAAGIWGPLAVHPQSFSTTVPA
ncbi:hypothetical protein C8J57DRAFT_1230292 [Mycena rebaudengoi]|nr:hypothetical protein C8J57DRAFT_1230292 [Mycena rebaudengoi]